MSGLDYPRIVRCAVSHLPAGHPNACGDCDPCLLHDRPKQAQALQFDWERQYWEIRQLREKPSQIVIDAYLGIMVLRTMCKKAGLTGGQEASDQLLERMTEEYPALPALSALRKPILPSEGL